MVGQATGCAGRHESAMGLVLIPFFILVCWFFISVCRKRETAPSCRPKINRIGVSDNRGENHSAGSEYDVFLSFRGPDTRNGFTDHLCVSMRAAGLHVFKDDEDICSGEAIPGELERAIGNSRIYVIVFSRNYASSTWCLRELTMMVDCCRDQSAGKIILPIFYGVDASDVKLQTELYQLAIDDHRISLGQKAVWKWEEALLRVGQISGWESKSIRGEGKLVRLIIDDVLKKLKIRNRNLPQHLTGIADRVEDMMKLLECNSPDQRLVVVHGIGGIGKTTLANVIFNRIYSRFEGCSFLPDVWVSSTGEEGIVKLQKKLLGDILGTRDVEVSDSSDGANKIRARLRGKRVLIILDDVNKRGQIKELVGNCNMFGPGTRIIITTRDVSIGHNLACSAVVSTYEMKEMKDDHALQLFSRHVFGRDEPLDDYATLSQEVVRTSGNLPLALEVIGGHLYGESKQIWESTLRKLEQVPDKEVMDILAISYEGLDHTEKQIFLDVACFSEDMPTKYAIYLWEACKFHPKSGLAVLTNKSLIKILPQDKFWMHSQVRDMGREIVRSEGHESLGKRSRLWVPQDALAVVLRKEGTRKILAIDLGAIPGQSLACENFRGMTNLRCLHLNGGELLGDFGNVTANLIWLSWYNCPKGLKPCFFNMNNLVVLRISRTMGSSMKKLVMGNLKVLEIYESSMTATPDFSWCQKLEILILKGCHELRTVHASIRKLKNLTSLNISTCSSLTSLPEELGCAKALRELVVMYCGTHQRRFSLPKSIGNLTSLSRLYILESPITEVPNAFAEMKSLEFFHLRHCRVRNLPDSVWGLKSLIEVDLWHTDVQELPESIRRLENLRVLRVKGTKVRKLPTSIVDLKKLEELDAAGCPLNGGLPDEIGRLSALTKLDLSSSKICQLPPTMSRLSSLQSLCLNSCDLIQELPELPVSLTKLEFTSKALWLVPKLSLLTNLTELSLSDGGVPNRHVRRQSPPLQLSGIGKLHKLKSLSLHLTRVPALLLTELGSLPRLEVLNLSCRNMESLVHLPSSLSWLSFSYIRTEMTWTRYSNLRFLYSLDLHLSTLKEIHLGGLDKLENLKDLRIRNCRRLEMLADLACLRRVSYFRLEQCPMLVEISGLDRMELLEELSILHCGSIRGIPNLSGLRRMRKVKIWWCDSLTSVPCTISECHLNIHVCRGLSEYHGICQQYQRRERQPQLVRGCFLSCFFLK